MKRIKIPVKFEGTVEVTIPNAMGDSQAIELAKIIALAKIVATTDNPDAPMDEAFEEYKKKYSLSDYHTAYHWNHATPTGLSGCWTLNFPKGSFPY